MSAFGQKRTTASPANNQNPITRELAHICSPHHGQNFRIALWSSILIVMALTITAFVVLDRNSYAKILDFSPTASVWSDYSVLLP